MLDPLPNTLSALIKVAVTDASKLDRKKYDPHYMNFHAGRQSSSWVSAPCLICEAGAVMASRFSFNYDEYAHPRHQCFPLTVQNKLFALDDARMGKYVRALRRLGVEIFDKDQINAIPASQYAHYTSWGVFDLHLKHMEGVACLLQRLGY